MKRGEHHVLSGPHHVLDELSEARLRGLGAHRHRAPPRRLPRNREEELPKIIEALVYVVRARAFLSTVEPIVVARGEDEGRVEQLIEVESTLEELVRTGVCACLYVSHVDDPLDAVSPVYVLNEGLESGDARRPVGVVTQKGELEGLARDLPRARRGGMDENEERDSEWDPHSILRFFSLGRPPPSRSSLDGEATGPTT